LLYLKAILSIAISSADLIITDSINSKEDILTHYKVPEDKIRVIYLGVNKQFSPISDPYTLEQIKKKYKIEKEYILSVSFITPRKNFPVLIKAFDILKRDKGIDIQLLIAGSKGWLWEETFRIVSELGLTDDVIFTGYVPDEDLVKLYNAAEIFVLYMRDLGCLF